jgi:hypothetical protein
VVVAVVAVDVVQMAVDQVIDVVAVRHRLVAAAGTVLVLLGVVAAAVLRRAAGRVLLAYFELVLLDAGLADVVQVAVVQVVHVVLVVHGGVAAAGTVLVTVVGVGGHGQYSFLRGMGWAGVQLGGVGQGIIEQIGNVPIGQGIKQVRPLAAAPD